MDVIPMGVRQQDGRAPDVLAQQPMSEIANPRAAVENESFAVDRNLDAGGVATEERVLRAGAWDRSPDPQNFTLKLISASLALENRQKVGTWHPQ